MRLETPRLAVCIALVLGVSGCGSLGKALFVAAVVSAHVVQATAALCAQDEDACNAGPAQRPTTIEIRQSRDPYAPAVDW